jgi:spore coat protein U-like protein
MKSAARILGVLAVVLIVATSSAWAQSASANLSVTATVIKNCRITTTALAFGNYDPTLGTDLDAATGAINIACTKGTTTTIGLDLGANPLGAVRRMADGGGNFLEYEIYQDAPRTTVWGSALADRLSTPAAPDKSYHAYTTYGRIPGTADAPAGAYTDTVQATVYF